MTESSAETSANVPCEHCALAIPNGARVCTHCNLYQGWRGKLGVSSTVLALLVALVSVLTQALPVMVGLFRPKTSHVTISQPYLDGTIMRIVATNSGEGAGSIETVTLRSRIANTHIGVRFRNPQDALIRPGSQQIVFDVVPRLSREVALDRARIALSRTRSTNDAAAVYMVVRESDGTLRDYNFWIDPANIALLLEGHAARCSSTERPTIDNGCVGSGFQQ